MKIWKTKKKKWKMIEKGQILLKKAQIDEKWGKKYVVWISEWKYGKTKKKVKNGQKGSYIAEKGLNWWKMKK